MLATAVIFLRQHALRVVALSLLLFGLAVLLGALLPAEGEMAREHLLLRVSLAAAELLVVLPVIVAVAYDLPNDVESGRVDTVLAAPLPRWRYVLGKGLGGFLLAALAAGFIHWILMVELVMLEIPMTGVLVPRQRSVLRGNGKTVLFDEAGRPPDFEVLQNPVLESLPEDPESPERAVIERKNRAAQFRALAAREGRVDIHEGDILTWEYDIPRPDSLSSPPRVSIEPKNLLAMGFPAAEGIDAEIAWEQPSRPVVKRTVTLRYRRPTSLVLEGIVLAPGPLRISLSPRGTGRTVTFRLMPDRAGRESQGLQLLSRPAHPLAVSAKTLLLFLCRTVILLVVALFGSTFLSGGVGVLLTLFVYLCAGLRSFLLEVASGLHRVGPGSLRVGEEPPGALFRALERAIEWVAWAASHVMPDLERLDGTPVLVAQLDLPATYILAGWISTLPYAALILLAAVLVFRRRDL